MKKPEKVTDLTEIVPLQTQTMTLKILGRTPLIMHRQSEKARRQLLLPPRPTNKAQRAQTLKHDPYEEFRGSAYVSTHRGMRTHLHMPGGCFKRAIAEAAIDIPGAAKAQIGRLVSLTQTAVDIWGVPYMRFDMVRQGGATKTPDTRFRCCLPEWATEITVQFVSTIISPQSLANLINASGMIRGVGDFRVEKGAGDYGQFHIVRDDDADWQRIVEEGGTEIQKRRMADPVPLDQECADLLQWFDQELERRQAMPVTAAKPSRRKKKNGEDDDAVIPVNGAGDGGDDDAAQADAN